MIQNELESYKSRYLKKAMDTVGNSAIKMWKSRLVHQEQRCHQLHSAMVHQQSQYQNILKGIVSLYLFL